MRFSTARSVKPSASRASRSKRLTISGFVGTRSALSHRNGSHSATATRQYPTLGITRVDAFASRAVGLSGCCVDSSGGRGSGGVRLHLELEHLVQRRHRHVRNAESSRHVGPLHGDGQDRAAARSSTRARSHRPDGSATTIRRCIAPARLAATAPLIHRAAGRPVVADCRVRCCSDTTSGRRLNPQGTRRS